MAGSKNTQVLFASRPQGAPTAANFRIVETPIPEPGPGEMLLRTVYLGLDPVIRLRMNEGSYWPAFEIGKPLGARTVCVVVKSNNTGFDPGDLLVMQGIWADYMISDGKAAVSAVNTQAANLPKIDPSRGSITAPLHILGITGFTAYVGLIEIGQPKHGETVVVSGASGAVGSVAGQMAKLKGCRVVGIAGGARKCDFVTNELGLDHAVDYKRSDFAAALKAACPNGVDIYFDNVGGDILDDVLARLARGARIIICGAISQYNNTTPVQGPKNYLSLLVNRARMEGMVVFDYADRYHVAIAEMAAYLKDGRMKSREDVVEGIDTFPEALTRLFTGENFGKLVLKVSD